MARNSSSFSPEIRPGRALLHPLWLASLGLLVVNDHVLKGGAIFPSELTGKLSDFAGLIVAPVLLATLLRVRSSRGWWLAHAAVGAVFSAIQLSAGAAGTWSAIMEGLGFPWLITRDVTDLVALPALLVSAKVLHGVMLHPQASSVRQSVEFVVGGTGLLCCAATSPAPAEPFVPDLRTDVYVNNAGREPVVVRARGLAPQVELQCDVVAEDPGRLLTEPLFGTVWSFTLEPDQNFGLRVNNEWDEWQNPSSSDRACFAALLDVDGMPPAVVFWTIGQVPVHLVPGYGIEEDAVRGRIEIHPSDDPDTRGEYAPVGDDVVFLVPPAMEPVTGRCAPQDDAGRLEWSEPLPERSRELLSIERGADGCFALDLGRRDEQGEAIERVRWYLCAPLQELGIEVGREVELSPIGTGSQGEGGILIRTLDQLSDEGEPLPPIEIQAYRGPGFPIFQSLQVAAIPEYDCGFFVADACGTVGRATAVTAGGSRFESTTIEPGEQVTLIGDDDAEMTVALVHSQQRAGLDPECAEGPGALGLDTEVIARHIATLTQ